MVKWIHSQINTLIEKHSFSDENLYLYLILIIATLFACAMHIMLITLTISFGLWPLQVANLASIIIFAVTLAALIKYKTYTLTGLVIAIDVIAYTLFASYITGTGNYIILYYFVLLLMQLIIPYSSIKTRVAVTIIILSAIIISLILGEFSSPILELTKRESSFFMSMFNVNLAFWGILIELVASNVIRSTIAQINTIRLEEYKNLAQTDPLTGLYNRRHADVMFAELFEKDVDRNCCVAMLDIDNFKCINDSMGHQAGDMVLCNLANILRSNLRKTDMIFRWGGEEFLVVLADIQLSSAAKILEKLRLNIENYTVVLADSADINFTVTIGVSELVPHKIRESIKLCDARMYMGKESGRNSIIFEGDLVEEMSTLSHHQDPVY